MALKQNGRLIHQMPLRHRGGATLAMEYPDSNKSGLRNIYMSDNAGISKSAAIPNGALANGAWILPQKNGGISAYTSVFGLSDIIANGALGLNTSSTLTGVGDASAIGQLIVSAIATITASGTVSANVVALLNTSATLASSGDLNGSITALGNAVANLAGTSSLTETLIATGKLEANITPFTELSPQNLASAVWSEQYASYNTAGTFGKLLQDAGGGSSPEVIAAAVCSSII